MKLMSALTEALDPANILDPGKVLPDISCSTARAAAADAAMSGDRGDTLMRVEVP